VFLGNPQGELLYCAMMAGFFTVLAVLLFLFLTRESGLKTDLRAVTPWKFMSLGRGRALAVVVPLWLLACGWFYNATLGDKFYEVQREEAGGAVTWRFVYRHPERVRVVPEADIARWTGHVGWERRSFRHALLVELKDGRQLRSAGVHPVPFAEQAVVLARWGIKVLPDEGEFALPQPPGPADGRQQD
jgi:hypothetical protein